MAHSPKPIHIISTPLQSSSIGFRYDTDKEVCVPDIDRPNSFDGVLYQTLKHCHDSHNNIHNHDVYVCDQNLSCVPRTQGCMDNEKDRTCFSTEEECMKNCKMRTEYECRRTNTEGGGERRSFSCEETVESGTPRLHVYATREECEDICSGIAAGNLNGQDLVALTDVFPWGSGVL